MAQIARGTKIENCQDRPLERIVNMVGQGSNNLHSWDVGLLRSQVIHARGVVDEQEL